MHKRAGKRVQIKRIKFQIKQAISTSTDPFPFLQKLRELEKVTPIEKPQPSSLKLIPLDFQIDYPDFRQIKKTDPRYHTYKIRYLFGTDE